MRLVVIESPFAHAKDDLNKRAHIWLYLRAALHDCLMRGEAPFASHALYTQDGVLDDWKPDHRAMGIDAGFAWGEKADLRVVYDDLGITPGMQKGIEEAYRIKQPIEYRRLAGWQKGGY